MTLDNALRLHALGFSLIPLKHGTKAPDSSVLPPGEGGLPSWKQFQSRPPTNGEIHSWFGDGTQRNAGVVLGKVSGVVVLESDSANAEAWCVEHLKPTPMATRSARGTHRYYRVPGNAPLPPSITVDGAIVEIKRDGQYVVAPGSVHPSGHVYGEVEPWPCSLDSVPEFSIRGLPADVAAQILAGPSKSRPVAGPPLPEAIGDGGRNSALFREGARLRRLGFDEKEILAALGAVNQRRCHPPLSLREVEGVAKSCTRYQPPVDAFPTTEAGDAEFFAATNADHVRYDHLRGRWLLFDGDVWVPQTNGEIARLALDAMRGRQRAAIGDKDRVRWALNGESRQRQTNMLALAQNIAPLADAGDGWDTDPWLLGARNGVIDLKLGALRTGRPDDRITMRVRAPFDPSATCAVWDKTFSEIFDADPELIAYVDRYIGYSLTGDCREESLAFCYGDGANGKGTLMNTLAHLLGDYADDLPFSAFELQSRAGIPNDIAKIVGKRFVTASETGEAVRLNEARVKALTGRDPITARFLHREFFTFQPVAKFWLATNHRPEVRDDSEGFWRRIHLIPFAASFIGRENRTLKDRLRDELPGILARAVRGCLAWQREGLNPPAVVREATADYRTTSLPLTKFLEECCVLQDGARAQFGQLFQAYVKWCGDTREARLGRHAFNEALHARFSVDASERRSVVFIGVGLVDLFAGREM